MSDHNHIGNYDHVRCQTCGCAWLSGVNERTGEMEPGHPDDLPCAVRRPTGLAPPWVGEALARHELAATASNLPPSTDDAEKARRELAGGTPTREWAADGVHTKNGVKAVGRQFHVTMDIEGGLRLPDSQLDGALIEHGRPLSAADAKHRMRQLRDQGFKVIPVCDHHDPEGNCLGHEEA